MVLGMLLPSHVATSEKFVDWRTFLASWVEQVNRYCAAISNDNPYWHGELTNVAFLMGTAFLLPQWFSLMEFPSAKDDPALIHASGRNDAWLKSIDGEYFIEAKQLWLELHQPDCLSAIQPKMAAAEQAARHIHAQPRAQPGIGEKRSLFQDHGLVSDSGS
jgi:hypothetical protein